MFALKFAHHIIWRGFHINFFQWEGEHWHKVEHKDHTHYFRHGHHKRLEIRYFPPLKRQPHLRVRSIEELQTELSEMWRDYHARQQST
jgi:hypothetical protein